MKTRICVWMVLLACAPAAHAADGNWDRSWGADVIQGAPTDPETCTVAITCKVGLTDQTAGGAFAGPSGVAVAPNGDVYVSDTSKQRIQKFSPDGTFLRAWGINVNPAAPHAFGVCTVAAQCQIGETGAVGGALNFPLGLAVKPNGNVVVAESQAARVSEFTSDGTFVRLWGRRVTAGVSGAPFGVCETAANCTAGFTSDGSNGEFSVPWDVATDAGGNTYVADWGEHRVQKFSPTGQWLRAWGFNVINDALVGPEICTVITQCQTGSGSQGAGGALDRPTGIAVGTDGSVYVAEAVGARISKFTSDGAFQRTWGKGVDNATAGSGAEVCTVAAQCVHAFVGPEGGAFTSPAAVAADASGAVYTQENARIQRFDSAGTFQLAWGKDVDTAHPGVFGICRQPADCVGGSTGGLGGELGGTGALESSPAGDLYVAEGSSNRITRFGPSRPDVPQVTGVSPGPVGDDNHPVISGTAPAGSTVHLYGDATCTGAELASGPAATFANPGIAITVADDTTTTVYATASAGGSTSPCSTTFVTYEEDSTTVPTTFLHFAAASLSTPEQNPAFQVTVQRTGDTTGATTVKYATTNGTATAPADFTAASGTLSFAAGETSRTFQVVLAFDGLVEGDETFGVALAQPSFGAAVDAPATATVTIVDDDFIDTAITFGPDPVTTNPSVAFAFTATPPAGATFECRIDAAEFAACTSPHVATVTDGEHTFNVRAVSPGGERDRSPATRTFSVDSVRPVATATATGEKTPTGKYVAPVTVTASASDPAPGSGIKEIRCGADPAKVPDTAGDLSGTCPMVLTAPGEHTVYVAAIDNAGWAGIPAKVTFTIVAPPDTAITDGPTGTTWATTAQLKFTSASPGATFRCRLDGGPFAACSSPHLQSPVKAGAHTFEVAAVSADGVVDPTPASRAWEVNGVQRTALRCDVQPVPRDAWFFFGYKGSDKAGCEVSSPCPPVYAGEGCLTLRYWRVYPTYQGFTHRNVTTVCPAGAVCTLRTKASFFDADPGRRWAAGANAELFPPDPGSTLAGRKSLTDFCESNGAQDRCTVSVSVSALGTGDTVGIACWGDDPSDRTQPGGGYGPDNVRRIECEGTLSVETAQPLQALAGSGSVQINAPAPGQLRVAPAPGGRLATASAAFTATTVRVAGAGPVTVPLKLTRAAKRKLRKRHKLGLSLAVALTPDTAGVEPMTATQRVTLRRPAKPQRHCATIKKKRRCTRLPV